jgi:hypothetical protein
LQRLGASIHDAAVLETRGLRVNFVSEMATVDMADIVDRQ